MSIIHGIKVLWMTRLTSINNSLIFYSNEAIRTQRKAISAQNKRDKEFIIKQHRYVFQTKSPVDVLDDGYQWRKYGKKIVKNNKFPRLVPRCQFYTLKCYSII